jgi:hypothetical protein
MIETRGLLLKHIVMITLKKAFLLIVFFWVSVFSYGCEKGYCSKQPVTPISVTINPIGQSEVQRVNVKFTVSEDGKIRVQKIDAVSIKLKKYVLAKLARLNLKGLDVAGNYNITISFSSKDLLT